MARWITVVEALEVPRPPSTVLPAIWDIQNVERLERKADAVTVHPHGERNGTYEVEGHFAGVPWQGRFDYELHPTGFHSRDADVPRDEATVEGGFFVTPLGAEHSTVIHYEQYVLAPWLAPLAPLVQRYLRHSMRRELRDLRRMVTGSARDVRAPAPRRTRAGTVGLRRA
ncbi:MAG TPA: hypothetical protein VI462_00620 [Acidimicrobiia bacterium]